MRREGRAAKQPSPGESSRLILTQRRAREIVHPAGFAAGDEVELAIFIPVDGFDAGFMVTNAEGLAVVQNWLSLETAACIAVEDDLGLLVDKNIEVAIVVPVGYLKAVVIRDRSAEIFAFGVLERDRGP